MVRALVFCLCLLAAPAWATTAPETAAPHAVVLDYATGQVLLNKGGAERIPTASMSKVATLYEVFAALKAGHITLDDTMRVSEKAWRMKGSSMFLEPAMRPTVEALIRGVAVQSGNDACVVLAEGLSGSETAFSMLMNARAQSLGLRATHFANATGWPDPEHYSTPLDLAHLAVAVIRDFPEYYPYFGEESFAYNNIKQMNRNPLLYRPGLGADGVKTGHTQEAGYGLIASAADAATGRRVVLAKLVAWGLSAFANRVLFAGGQAVVTAPVAKGAMRGVALVPARDVLVTVPRGRDGSPPAPVVAEARLPAAPLIAPVAAGAEVGVLHIAWEGGSTDVPLLTGQAVPRAGLFARITQNARALVGW